MVQSAAMPSPSAPRAPSALPAALGRAVRRLRVAAGFSQEAFADVVGVHRTYLGLIERGAVNVTLTTLEKLATALGLTPARLLDEVAAER